LKIVVVVDMWLTGTDIPCLHTLYIDKPMRGHTMIQAISRVNRVFRDKPSGLVVDYIGIGDELREATNTYTGGGGRGEPAPEIGEAARPVFFKTLEEIRSALPAGHEYGKWRSMTGPQIEDLYSLVYGVMAERDTPRRFPRRRGSPRRCVPARQTPRRLSAVRRRSDFLFSASGINCERHCPAAKRRRTLNRLFEISSTMPLSRKAFWTSSRPPAFRVQTFQFSTSLSCKRSKTGRNRIFG
jgi:hypothetical protein